MNRGGLAILEEIIDKFRVLSAVDREKYAQRLALLVGPAMASWLVPLLVRPPTPTQLEAVKAALAAHAKFEAALAEFRDTACPGARALAALASWAVAPREPDEEDPDADDGS